MRIKYKDLNYKQEKNFSFINKETLRLRIKMEV